MNIMNNNSTYALLETVLKNMAYLIVTIKIEINYYN